MHVECQQLWLTDGTVSTNSYVTPANKSKPQLEMHLLVQNYCTVLKITTPLFCKKGTTHTISILEQKQEGGSVLHTTDV